MIVELGECPVTVFDEASAKAAGEWVERAALEALREKRAALEALREIEKHTTAKKP